MSLDFAPELKFIKESNGAAFYQLEFAARFLLVENEMFPMPFPHQRNFLLTVAAKDDRFTLNLKDDAGLDVYSPELSLDEFKTKWADFIKRLKN